MCFDLYDISNQEEEICREAWLSHFPPNADVLLKSSTPLYTATPQWSCCCWRGLKHILTLLLLLVVGVVHVLKWQRRSSVEPPPSVRHILRVSAARHDASIIPRKEAQVINTHLLQPSRCCGGSKNNKRSRKILKTIMNYICKQHESNALFTFSIKWFFVGCVWISAE